MRLSKKLVAVGIVAGVAVTATSAFAYFTSTGTGSGSAAVGTSTTWAVTTSAATGGPLTPGGPSQTVAYQVKNNSSGNQKLQTVSVAVANADNSTWTSGTCSLADFTVGINGFVPTDLGAGQTYSGTATVTMINRPVSQDDCKNAVVPLFFSAS